MRVQESVRKMTLTILAGELFLTALMLLVFVLLGRFDMTVLLGALLGAFFAVLNFFLMGLSVQRAADNMNGVTLSPEDENAETDADEDTGAEQKQKLSPASEKARRQMQVSYSLRMLMLVAAAVLGLLLPCFHPLAVVIPFLFPRLIIQVVGMREGGNAAGKP